MAVEKHIVRKPTLSYKAGYKYQVAGDFWINTPILGCAGGTSFTHIDGTGKLVIKEGYCWDGATGVPDYKSSIVSSLVHDAIYQLIRAGVLDKRHKDIADFLLEQLCEEDGMSQWHARLWQWGVKLFGGSATRPSSEKPILSAP